MRLLLAFIFFIVMMRLSGGGGSFYIDRIQGNISNLTDTAVPLFKTSGSLVAGMQKANAGLLWIQRTTDERHVSYGVEVFFFQALAAFFLNPFFLAVFAIF